MAFPTTSAPVLSAGTPSYPGGLIAKDGIIELLFEQAVQRGSGKIYLTDGRSQSYQARDGSMATRIVGATETREITVDEITFSDGGKRLIIDPDTDLTVGKTYHLLFVGNAVTDSGGHAFQGFSHTDGFTLTAFQPVLSATITGLQIDDSGIANDGYTSVAAQTISGTVSSPLHGGEYVEVSVDGGTTWHSAAFDGPTWQTSLTLNNGDGAYTVWARVSNGAGDHSSTYTYAMELDRSAVHLGGNLSLANPAVDQGVSVSDGVIDTGSFAVHVPLDTLSGNAKPGDKLYLVDQMGETTVGSYTLTAADFSSGVLTLAYKDISVNLADGEYLLQAFIEDRAGNVGTGSGTVSLVVDTTAPTLTSSTPADGSTAAPAAIALQFDENVYFTAGSKFTIINQSNTSQTWEIDAGSVAVAHSGSSITIDLMMAGVYLPDETQYKLVLSGGIIDTAGNALNHGSTLLTFTVPDDPLPPTALLDMSAFAFDSSVGYVEARLSGDLTDTRVQFSINGGGTWLEGNQSGDYWSFVSPYGAFSVLDMRVVDSAGNVGSGVSGVTGPAIVTVTSDYNETMSTSGHPVLFTRGGDDTVTLVDPITYFDGGSGVDTLILTGSTAASFSGWQGKLRNVEKIALDTTSSLDASDANAVLGFGVSALRIDGAAANTVNIGNSVWTATGHTGGYYSYTANNITLEVADTLTLVGMPAGTA